MFIKTQPMKKIILSILMVLAIGFSSFAQRVEKKTVKVKHTSSFKQKIHNTFHKHHKQYNGYKVKTKVRK
jgi:ABC-type metal ion transport system substrate-binding protein